MRDQRVLVAQENEVESGRHVGIELLGAMICGLLTWATITLVWGHVQRHGRTDTLIGLFMYPLLRLGFTCARLLFHVSVRNIVAPLTAAMVISFLFAIFWLVLFRTAKKMSATSRGC